MSKGSHAYFGKNVFSFFVVAFFATTFLMQWQYHLIQWHLPPMPLDDTNDDSMRFQLLCALETIPWYGPDTLFLAVYLHG